MWHFQNIASHWIVQWHEFGGGTALFAQPMGYSWINIFENKHFSVNILAYLVSMEFVLCKTSILAVAIKTNHFWVCEQSSVQL